MATIASARLAISAGAVPGSAVVGLHGVLDLPAAIRLRTVLDAILEDRDILAIGVDLHDVCGVDVGGISGLASAAARVDDRGAELTLHDPPELVCLALELEGLTGLIRMGGSDGLRRVTSTEIDLRRARRRHPSGQPVMDAASLAPALQSVMAPPAASGTPGR